MTGIVHAFLVLKSEQHHIALGYRAKDQVLARYERALSENLPTFKVNDADGREHIVATGEFVRIYDYR